MSRDAEDRRFMAMALRLARRGLGATKPNPMVGAVAVRNGRVISAGWHRACGGPHAEAMALAGQQAAGASLYVTLEPCAHHGRTPPCADLIAAAGVKRVVAAMIDPNPLVNGVGLARLRAAGIETRVGVLGERAERLNRHYLKFMHSGLPWVTLHAGVSLDGKMTDRAGRSRWVTSPELRRLAHALRGEFSAILAGRNTVLADDPQLTLREPGWECKKLLRVVLDSGNTLPKSLAVFRGQERFPLAIFSAEESARRGRKAERHFFVPAGPGGVSLTAVLETLGKMGVASVLVEGGGQVLDSFVGQGLFDEAALFYSGKLLGGRDSVQPFVSGAAAIDLAPELGGWTALRLAGGFFVRGVRTCSPA